MKRILLLVALVVVAGIAGIVRSHSKAGDFDRLVSHDASDQVREEIRQSYQLAPGASVELMNIYLFWFIASIMSLTSFSE